MALIYLIRHGQDAARRRVAIDPGLSGLGREQADAMAERMRTLGPLAMVSSPLNRARETAAPLADIWRVKPVIDPVVTEVPSPPEEDRAAWFERVFTGSWNEAGDVVVRWRQDIIDYLRGLHDDTVIVTHFVVINAAFGVATGSQRIVNFRPANCSVTTMKNEHGVLELVERGSEASTVVR
jgi:broad specificity phosphatase PhoE